MVSVNTPFSEAWAIPGLFFFIFVFSIQLTVNVQYKCLPVTGFELEATALLNEPQPLHSVAFVTLVDLGPTYLATSAKNVFENGCFDAAAATKYWNRCKLNKKLKVSVEADF